MNSYILDTCVVLTDRRYNDSDDVSDHELGHNKKLIETGDDTRHEEPNVARLQELLQNMTQPMSDGSRSTIYATIN